MQNVEFRDAEDVNLFLQDFFAEIVDARENHDQAYYAKIPKLIAVSMVMFGLASLLAISDFGSDEEVKGSQLEELAVKAATSALNAVFIAAMAKRLPTNSAATVAGAVVGSHLIEPVLAEPSKQLDQKVNLKSDPERKEHYDIISFDRKEYYKMMNEMERNDEWKGKLFLGTSIALLTSIIALMAGSYFHYTRVKELEDQLIALQKIKEEKKDEKVSDSKQVENLKEQLAKAKLDFKESKNALDALRVFNSQILTDVATSREQNKKILDEKNAVEQKFAEQKKAIEADRKELKDQRIQLDKQQEDIKKLKDQNIRLTQKQNEIQKESKTREEELKKQNVRDKKLAQQKFEAQTKELDKEKKGFKKLEDQNFKLKQEQEKIQQDLELKEKELKQNQILLRQKEDALKQKNVEFEKEQKKFQSDFKAQQEKLDKDKNDLKEKIGEYEVRLSTIFKVVDKTQKGSKGFAHQVIDSAIRSTYDEEAEAVALELASALSNMKENEWQQFWNSDNKNPAKILRSHLPESGILFGEKDEDLNSIRDQIIHKQSRKNVDFPEDMPSEALQLATAVGLMRINLQEKDKKEGRS